MPSKIILKGSAIRVGQPGASVAAGAPVPGKPGKFYEAGQFSPNLEELVSSTMSEANDAGLLSGNLPIFGDDGKVDDNMTNAWNPYDDFYGRGIIVSGHIPKYSLAVFSSLQDKFPGMLGALDVTGIENSEDSNSRAIVGTQLITAVTNTQGRKFKATLVTYPAFHQYISTPVVRSVPGRSAGISVSTYATFKALGHILFAKLAYDGELEIIGKFLTVAGWSKSPKSENIKGNFLGKQNLSSYTRENRETGSEIEKYSFQDDFADTFAQYLTHRNYMQTIAPDKIEIMELISNRYPNAI